MKTIIAIVVSVLLAIGLALSIATWMGWLTGQWWLQNLAPIGGSILTILSVFVSVLMLNHQIKSSGDSALSVEKAGRRNALNLEIYRALTDRVEAADEALSELISYERRCCWQLDSCRSALRSGTHLEIVADPQKLLDLHGELGRAVVLLIKEIERWESAVQNFDVFRYAFSSAHHDEMVSFHKLFPLAVRLLPGGVDRCLAPEFYRGLTAELVGEFEAACNDHIAASQDLSNFGFDLRVETQNALVSHLFQRKVNRRTPEDPEVMVVTIEDMDRERLKRHFTEWSPLGRSNQAAIASVRAAVSARRGDVAGAG